MVHCALYIVPVYSGIHVLYFLSCCASYNAIIWFLYGWSLNRLGRDVIAWIAKTLGSISIRHRSDVKVSDRYLIDVNLRVFAMWVCCKSSWSKSLKISSLKMCIFWSWLVQVMACCLAGNNHYLNQWWLDAQWVASLILVETCWIHYTYMHGPKI